MQVPKALLRETAKEINRCRRNLKGCHAERMELLKHPCAPAAPCRQEGLTLRQGVILSVSMAVVGLLVGVGVGWKIREAVN